MDKTTFETRLRYATERVIENTRHFIINELPSEYRYFIYPNSSNDEGKGPIGNDEERFPEDSQLGVIGPAEAVEAINFLWRNGRVPQWIDSLVRGVDEKYTYINLTCCGRFMGDNRHLYHEKYGLAPFNLGGVRTPHMNWKMGEKFDINEVKNW